MLTRGQHVILQTDKYKGYKGEVICYTEPHKLSSEDRLQVNVQTGYGWKVLLINECNLNVGV